MPLNICHVTETFLPKLGGLQIVVDQLAQELARRGHRVTVACPDYGDLKGPAPGPGYQVERCFGSTVPSFGFGVLAWRRLLARERFDVIHAHNAWPGGTLGLMGRAVGAATLVTSHGRDILVDRSIGYGSRLNPVVSALIRWTLARTQVHTVVSDSMVGAAQAAGSETDKIKVVPNFLTSSVSIQPSPKRQPYLLMVGRLHAVKAVDLALAAFKETRADFPQMRLKIVGHGGERHKLQALAGRLAIEDSVDWLGPVVGEEKEGLIREATALLLTSHVEAFCLSALEAMALGTPVIAPDRRPFTDIIGDRNGLFIRPDEPKTLVPALKRLTKPDYADELGRRGLEVAAGFTRAAAVDEYENIYYRLVAQGNK